MKHFPQVITGQRLPIKLWLEEIEGEALAQAKNLANLPFSYKWVAIMPDCHVGYGMPIGGVLACDQVIIPNAVGVDIGCGMMAIRTNLKEIDTDILKKIMGQIRKAVPVGFSHHKEKQDWAGFDKAPDDPIVQKEIKSAHFQIGTLGGGNHFIEIQKGSDEYIWIMIHSGSRNIGLKVASSYNRIAQSRCQEKFPQTVDQELSFLSLDSVDGQKYLQAMNFCLDFAQANRDLMAKGILEIFKKETKGKEEEIINIHHNFAVLETHFGKKVVVHRKGATKATLGLKGIIPGSMGTPSYIVEGLGSEESFQSCSHGAGRKMSRKKAVQTLDLDKEQQKMIGIVYRFRNKRDLEEAPGAYKDIDEVMAAQADLVRIVLKLKPLAVIKV